MWSIQFIFISPWRREKYIIRIQLLLHHSRDASQYACSWWSWSWILPPLHLSLSGASSSNDSFVITSWPQTSERCGGSTSVAIAKRINFSYIFLYSGSRMNVLFIYIYWIQNYKRYWREIEAYKRIRYAVIVSHLMTSYVPTILCIFLLWLIVGTLECHHDWQWPLSFPLPSFFMFS